MFRTSAHTYSHLATDKCKMSKQLLFAWQGPGAPTEGGGILHLPLTFTPLTHDWTSYCSVQGSEYSVGSL